MCAGIFAEYKSHCIQQIPVVLVTSKWVCKIGGARREATFFTDDTQLTVHQNLRDDLHSVFFAPRWKILLVLFKFQDTGGKILPVEDFTGRKFGNFQKSIKKIKQKRNEKNETD